MTGIDATLVQEVLNVPKREREPDLQHHRQADDLGPGLDVAEGKRLVIPPG